MSSLSHFDIHKVEREYEKLRVHLVADLRRLNAVLPFPLMLRRNEIDLFARQLVHDVRKAPYRRDGPLLVRWVGAIRTKATSAMHRSEREQLGTHDRYLKAGKNETQPEQEEPSQAFGDIPNIPFTLTEIRAEADMIRAANSNRPRP